MSETDYDARLEADKLRQEILNEENEAIAAENPVWAKEKEAIEKAMDILMEAEIPVVMFAECHIAEHKPFIQYNSLEIVNRRKNSDEEDVKRQAHEWWWKQGKACLHYFDILGNPKNLPHHNALNFLIHVNNVTLETWNDSLKP